MSARDELLAQSDYVVLTVPLTPETRHLIGRAELARMKPTSILVNIARGPVVDTDALDRGLDQASDLRGRAGRDRSGAVAARHPLLKLDNVTITPHLGSATEQTRLRMAQMSIENLLAGLAGKPLPYPVLPATV